MDSTRYSQVYIQRLKAGPFPGRIDPWSEAGRYFKQIHAGMISSLLEQTQDTLLQMGYVASREASLQIAEGREPDIFVQRAMNAVKPEVRWNYELAAAEILAEPGITVESDVDLQAIHVRQMESHRLVTVVEIISPNNKTKRHLMADYRVRRERLLMENGVNIVVIDATRSTRHLLNNPVTSHYAYHVAVYLPDESPHFIGIEYGQPLKRVALPLRGEVVPMELQNAYDDAYQAVSIAVQIAHDGHYMEDELPFPSLLTVEQRREGLAAVTTWQAELARLRNEI